MSVTPLVFFPRAGSPGADKETNATANTETHSAANKEYNATTHKGANSAANKETHTCAYPGANGGTYRRTACAGRLVLVTK